MRLKFAYSALLPVAVAFQPPAFRHFASAAAAASTTTSSSSASKTVLSSSSTATTDVVDVKSFVNNINNEYEKLHKAFELQFWGTKMVLEGDSYSVSELTKTKGEMERFLADETKLQKVREFLSEQEENNNNYDPTTFKTLKMLERTFGQ